MANALLDGNVTDQNDVPVAGALVYVYESPSGLADLTDSMGQAVTNPVTAGEDGYWSAYAETDKYYTLKYYWGGRLRLAEANVLLGTAGPLGINTDPNVRSDLAASTGAGLVGYIDGGTGAVARTAQAKVQELGRSATDYATAAERTSFAAFDAVENAQVAVAAGLTATQTDAGTLTLPYGKFPVSQVLVPADNTAENRGRAFSIVGSGSGEPFVVNDSLRRGTVLVGTDATKAALKTQQQTGTVDARGGGGFRFENFRVEATGNTGVPAIDLATFYGPNIMSRVDVYQQGAGDGIHVGYMATGKIEMGYILGAAWLDGVGAVGNGLFLKAAANAGLQTISKVTSRGFATGYQLGETGGNNLLAPSLTDCEVSYCTDGVVITAACKAAGIERTYLEGVTGTGISDAGNATRVSNPFIELAFTVGAKLSGYGGGVAGGYFGLKPTGATGVQITSAAFGAYVNNAYFIWGGNDGTSTAVAIEVQAAADPKVSLLGNTFNPEGQWTGPGSAKIKDSSYSSSHGGSGQANGSGVFGLMQRESGFFDVIPALSRGTINLHVDGQILTDAYIVGNTLALSNASVQYLSLSGAQMVNRFTAPNLPDKTGKLFVDNGYLTLTPTVYVVGLARRIVLPAGKQAWIEYQVLPTANAPVSITSIRLLSTSFTVAELATLEGDFDQTIFASNGRRSGEGVGVGTGCPVWWDGTNWRTFYDNTVVAA